MKPLSINKRKTLKCAKYKVFWYKSMRTMLKNKGYRNIKDKTVLYS